MPQHSQRITPYTPKKELLSGTSITEVTKKARIFYRTLEKRTKRKPYIRSAYFRKQKVFFDYFWHHLNQKGRRYRLERLKLLPLAVDVIRYSRNPPLTQDNPANRNEILHRFAGKTKGGRLFYVQIKEDKRKNRKYFMSSFWAK